MSRSLVVSRPPPPSTQIWGWCMSMKVFSFMALWLIFGLWNRPARSLLPNRRWPLNWPQKSMSTRLPCMSVTTKHVDGWSPPGPQSPAMSRISPISSGLASADSSGRQGGAEACRQASSLICRRITSLLSRDRIARASDANTPARDCTSSFTTPSRRAFQAAATSLVPELWYCSTIGFTSCSWRASGGTSILTSSRPSSSAFSMNSQEKSLSTPKESRGLSTSIEIGPYMWTGSRISAPRSVGFVCTHARRRNRLRTYSRMTGSTASSAARRCWTPFSGASRFSPYGWLIAAIICSGVSCVSTGSLTWPASPAPYAYPASSSLRFSPYMRGVSPMDLATCCRPALVNCT